MARHKVSRVEQAIANCLDCRWAVSTSSAMSAGARHHDTTGHQVEVTQTITVRYGASRVERARRKP